MKNFIKELLRILNNKQHVACLIAAIASKLTSFLLPLTKRVSNLHTYSYLLSAESHTILKSMDVKPLETFQQMFRLPWLDINPLLFTLRLSGIWQKAFLGKSPVQKLTTKTSFNKSSCEEKNCQLSPRVLTRKFNPLQGMKKSYLNWEYHLS